MEIYRVSDNELAKLIQEQLSSAETTLSSFQSRGLSVLGIAGALVTAAGGLFAIASGATHQVHLSSNERLLLALSFVAFVCSCVSSLIVNRPRNINDIDAAHLQELAISDYDADGWGQQVTVLRSKMLVSMSDINRNKARWLSVAILLEIIGIALVACVAILVVGHEGV
jgi:hypothetical protein